jgi:deoxyxylulose-5-phosphate synthase
MQGISVCRIGVPDSFITHGDRKSLLKEAGLDDESILKKAKEFLSLTEEKRQIVFKSVAASKEPIRVQARK